MHTPTHRTVAHFTASLASACLLFALASCSTAYTTPHTIDSTPSPVTKAHENTFPKRVLFIGNSYLYYNDSLHNHVRRMATEKGPYPSRDYKYKSATIGGARLAHHPVELLLEPGRLGVERPFELVVVQGGSMEPLTPESRAQFRQSATDIAQKVRATGAELALYMTHAYVPPERRYEPNQIDTISAAYVSVGKELNARVIPVGLAFERAYARRPDIKLHKSFDGSHPSLLGTYLAACVVYQSLYGKPSGPISYDYFGSVDAQDALFLQKIASDTVGEFRSRNGQ